MHRERDRAGSTTFVHVATTRREIDNGTPDPASADTPAMTTAHTWAFRASRRRRAFGGSGTGKAIDRLNAAVAEVAAMARAATQLTEHDVDTAGALESFIREPPLLLASRSVSSLTSAFHQNMRSLS